MFLALFLSQVALALCQCQCEERHEYYSSYACTQPAYDYSEYQSVYNPYSPTGYSYNYGTYVQPTSYDTTSAIVYPYPIPVVYESPKEERPACGCGCKNADRDRSNPYNEHTDRYDVERDYCSSRCSCTSSEYERRFPDNKERKPKCSCKHSEDYRSYPDRYYDREYENSDCGCSKVKCICICDETMSDYRDKECDRGYYRESGRDSGCRCRNKHDEYFY